MIIEGVEDKNYVYDEGRQTLFILHDATPGHVHAIRISFDPPVQPTSASILTFLLTYAFALIALLAVITYHFLH